MERHIFQKDLEKKNKKGEKINQLSPAYMRATCRELKQRLKL